MGNESASLEQANVRVSWESYEILEAAAFVRGYRSLQELLRPPVEAFAAKLAKESDVQAALAARRAYETRKVTSLPADTSAISATGRPGRARRSSPRTRA